MAFARHHGTKRPTNPASFFYADSNTIFDAGSGPAAALRFGMRLATCLQSTRCLTDLLNKVADDEVQIDPSWSGFPAAPAYFRDACGRSHDRIDRLTQGRPVGKAARACYYWCTWCMRLLPTQTWTKGRRAGSNDAGCWAAQCACEVGTSRRRTVSVTCPDVQEMKLRQRLLGLDSKAPSTAGRY